LAEAQAILRWLEANGVFTVALDGQQEWYQYHPMFRQLLRHQLQQESAPAQIAEVHRRASLWYADQGLTEEAIRHALAAGDTAHAVQIVAMARPAIMNLEEWWRLEHWVRLFPKEIAAREPELLLAQAWAARSQYQIARLQALAVQATAALAAEQEALVQNGRTRITVTQLEGEIEILRTFLCYWQGDMAGVVRHGVRGLAQTPVDLCAIRNLAVLFLGGGYQAAGDLPRAYALYADHLAAAVIRGGICLRSYLLAKCPVLSIAADLPALAENLDRILALTQDIPWDAHTSVTYYYLASVHYYHNNLAAVEEALAELLPLRYHSVPHIFAQSACLLAATYQAQQRTAEANTVMTLALAHCNETGHINLMAILRAFEAELALRQGRLDDARFLALELAETPFPQMPFFYAPHMTLVKLYLREETPASVQKAFDLIERLEEFLVSTHNVRFLMEVLALKAMALQARGEQAAAVAAIARAIRLGEPGGYIRVFADLGQQIDGLLAQLAAQDVAPLLVAAIRTALEPAASPLTSTPQRAAPVADIAFSTADAEAHLANLLTYREQDVLRLLGQRLTNQEIAEAMSIAPETVKRHTFNIYRKLHVNNFRSSSFFAFSFSDFYAVKNGM
jgi:LuxR family maltose regulon positive regulatory protein